MKRMPPAPVARPRAQRGFILVTSLIFLVILTLLAVSAINSSTLQERMAANQREKSRALDAADSALRHVETVLASDDFRTCNTVIQPSGSSANGSCDDDASNLTIVAASDSDDDSATRYLSDAFWSQAGVSTYQLPDNTSTSGLKVQYVVEYVRQEAYDLNPDSSGSTLLFRITARARGTSAASRAVVQSVYRITT